MIKNRSPLWKQILEDQTFRKALARKSFYWFFHIYFAHYIKYETAEFQKEIFSILENKDISNAVIVAFRGSAKSTVTSLAFSIWSILCDQKRNYIILISQTQQLSRQMLTNIRQELLTNELLIKDFGPFQDETTEEWRASSLVIKPYNVRIAGISTNEAIRGTRYLQFRPDLIIADDIEDLESVKSKESREKNWRWLTGEVIPIGDTNTKMVFIGNMLHEDSIMMRLKQHIADKSMVGVYKEYPLIDDAGKILWSSKFPSMNEITALRKTVASDSAWHREYLLKIIADEDRVIVRDWIKYYDKLPEFAESRPRLVTIGTDLAISEKETADFTAFVAACIYGYGDKFQLYILPKPINKRMLFPKTIEVITNLHNELFMRFHSRTIVYVEAVAYQLAFAQQLIKNGVHAEEFKVAGLDKRSRLNITADYIQSGKILFPSHGAEDLIDQIVNFGIEKHDDLVDAFTTLVIKAIEGDSFGWGSLDISKCNIKPITAGLMDRKF